uniref:Uncharacterized protein n=1 Tax=Sinocyclocheilus grahami TaxID=75366 RepID=A0A672PJP4_SINGR
MTKWLIITLLFTTHYFVCWGQDSVDQPLREKTSAEGNQLPNKSPTVMLSDFSIGKGTTEPEFQERFHTKLDSKLETPTVTETHSTLIQKHDSMTLMRNNIVKSLKYTQNSSGGGDSHTVCVQILCSQTPPAGLCICDSVSTTLLNKV